MRHLLLPIAGMATILTTPARGEPVMELEADVEVAMALSAAPPHLREHAGIYRLGAEGYQLVRPSTNGFVCIVEREASMGLAPVCYDREGSETNLQATLFRGRLLRQGKSPDEIRAAIDAGYQSGRLMAPRRPGIAYMLSTHFTQVDPRSGQRQCIFPPHIMFYAPYLPRIQLIVATLYLG